ncbi:phosphoglycerate mutase-like protein [Xylariomycetidae sp. FL0641]|nr:phosphoglycerate mutase-like protein [Xylariomycetidae sp. FL0641]
MHLLLIRHGESVDNVAGLYAGIRDSPLTSHGVLQTKRLGAHLVKRHANIGPIKHLFASNLQRASQTAEAIADAVKAAGDHSTPAQPVLELVKVPELREKDFGSSEGKKFGSRAKDIQDGNTQSDSESPDSMKTRINRFLDVHLAPVISNAATEDVAVVVVAHGIILNVLLRALTARYPRLPSTSRIQTDDGASNPEFSAAWSNTGVLQAEIRHALASSDQAVTTDQGPSTPRDLNQATPPRLSMMVEFTNNVDHLQGLKKTKGGIGSAKFDSKQRTMDSFFGSASKKRKLEEAEE